MGAVGFAYKALVSEESTSAAKLRMVESWLASLSTPIFRLNSFSTRLDNEMTWMELMPTTAKAKS